MKFRIIISPAASRDVDRLEDWLIDKDPASALRVGEVLEAAIASLDEMAERGRPVSTATRELNARFGQSVYVIRYRVINDQVVVARIFHGRERR